MQQAKCIKIIKNKMQDGDLIIIYKVEHIQNEASFFLAIIWVDFFLCSAYLIMQVKFSKIFFYSSIRNCWGEFEYNKKCINPTTTQ